jgi:selenocysteine-specific elongation factor
MRVIGTAGHVDHGKSSLVRALTGTDPDRWEEERRRGMTLDLGFARLRFPDGTDVGIVDVPGHERFVHNMLAGATGMDVLLLVVAANEGPRPQTFEHLAILSLLDVPAAIVALTKCDLVDDEALALAREDLAIAVAGTVAENAPVVAVSSATGEGLDELRERIRAALAALPPRAEHAPAYLPIDRAFTLTGHGTIVTGTLMQGTLAVGDALDVRPGEGTARVRSIEVFGETRERVLPGSRVAANLSGVTLADVERGSALVAPEIASAGSMRVQFQPLREAIGIIRRRMPVRVHLGAGETFGTLVFDAAPADDGVREALLHLRAPRAVVPGQRFVVRRMSPKTVLGGGTIGAPAAAGSLPGDGAAGDELGAGSEERASPDVVAVRAALEAAGLAASTAETLGARANVRIERVNEILADDAAEDRVWTLARPVAFIAASAAEELVTRVLERLERHHAASPWMLGATSLALSRDLGVAEPLLVRVLAAALERERLASRGGYYARNGFTAQLTAEQIALIDRFTVVDPAAPLVPAPFEPLVLEIRRSKIAGVSTALDTLLALGRLVRVGEHVYRGEQMTEIRARLIQTLRAKKRITMAEFRDVVGTSRKYVVPLLEHFDSTGLTIRDGDYRSLRTVR